MKSCPKWITSGLVALIALGASAKSLHPEDALAHIKAALEPSLALIDTAAFWIEDSLQEQLSRAWGAHIESMDTMRTLPNEVGEHMLYCTMFTGDDGPTEMTGMPNLVWVGNETIRFGWGREIRTRKVVHAVTGYESSLTGMHETQTHWVVLGEGIIVDMVLPGPEESGNRWTLHLDFYVRSEKQDGFTRISPRLFFSAKQGALPLQKASDQTTPESNGYLRADGSTSDTPPESYAAQPENDDSGRHTDAIDDAKRQIMKRKVCLTLVPGYYERLFVDEGIYGAELGLRVLSKRLQIDARFMTSYADLLGTLPDDMGPAKPLAKRMEMGAGWNVLSFLGGASQLTYDHTEKERRLGGEVEKDVYAIQGGTSLNFVQVRLGGHYDQVAVKTEAVDTVPTADVGITYLNKTPRYLDSRSTLVHAGLGFTQKALIDKKSGRGVLHRQISGYADLLVASSVKCQLPSGVYTNLLVSQRLGMRVGADVVFPQPFSLMGGIEFGLRPGVYEYITEYGDGRSIYGLARVGIASGWF